MWKQVSGAEANGSEPRQAAEQVKSVNTARKSQEEDIGGSPVQSKELSSFEHFLKDLFKIRQVYLMSHEILRKKIEDKFE